MRKVNEVEAIAKHIYIKNKKNITWKINHS